MLEDSTLEHSLVSPDAPDSPSSSKPSTRWLNQTPHPHRPRIQIQPDGEVSSSFGAEGSEAEDGANNGADKGLSQDKANAETANFTNPSPPIHSSPAPHTTSDFIFVASPFQKLRSGSSSRRMRVLPDALDRLREHPRFAIERAHERTIKGSQHDDQASMGEILLSHSVDEADREPLYHLELLRMFRQRLRIVAILGILLLPVFHLFYGYLSPAIAQQAIVPHAFMLATCVIYWLLAPRTTNLVWARLLTVSGYSMICTGAMLMMTTLAQLPSEDASGQSIQFVILAAHSQILLSVVLLPLSLWESVVMTSIVAVSLVWSAWWVLPLDSTPARSAQIFVLSTTAVFVLCLTQFQSLLRRRAFDSAFDLARSAAQLQELSTLDAVTGGFNRLYLNRTLGIEINRAARFHHPLSVMMFDLDNFKTVNDTQGHPVGDEVLRLVWKAATEAVRDVDTVARYGGDEFMVVLPETETADALAIAQRLQIATSENLCELLGNRGPECRVTLSIGLVTLSPTEPVSVDNVITLADERLYEAKRMGKNRIAV